MYQHVPRVRGGADGHNEESRLDHPGLTRRTRMLFATIVALGALAGCQPSSVVAPARGRTLERSNPIGGAALFVDPLSRAASQAAAWRASRPADASLMDVIAAQPVAAWMTEWSTRVGGDVAAVVARARLQGTLPLFVAYNLPYRNCATTGTTANAYRAWVRDFAAGLSGRSIVVLEPDAVSQSDCLSAAARQERYALLRDAVQVLKGANAAVYLDAGNATWLSADDAAARLAQAGIDFADGFALNVAHYLGTATNVAFGEQLSGRLDGAHFVVDVSRNGAGGAGTAWCNVPGQALGENPSTRTEHPLLDAVLWIKQPGESDGTCNGGPAAGTWWPEYALGLAQRRLALTGK